MEYWQIFLLLFLAAILIGILASMVGVGGGGFMVPLLALTQLVQTTQHAVGSSLIPVVFNALSSTLAYWRQGVIDVRFGLMLVPTALFGGWLGAYLTEYISSSGLAIAFGIFLSLMSLMMLSGREPKELGQLFRSRRHADGRPSLWAGSLIGFVAGLGAGFFGIGGGVIMVPAMNLLLGVDIIKAVATSLFVMGPPALVAAIQHGLQNNLHWELSIPLALGVIIGAQVGPLVTAKLPKKRLRQLFGVVVLYVATNMIWKGLH
jgi:hypothetical protein